MIEISDDVRRKAALLVENIELVDIRPARVLATLSDGATPGENFATATIEVAAGHRIGVGDYSSRFDFRISLFAEAERLLATVEFDLILDYDVNPEFEPDPEAAAYYSSTREYFAAFPHARELLQSLTTRLRLPTTVLGLLRRNVNGGASPVSVRTVGPMVLGQNPDFVDGPLSSQEDQAERS